MLVINFALNSNFLWLCRAPFNNFAYTFDKISLTVFAKLAWLLNMELNLNNPESSQQQRKVEDRFEFIDRLCVRISNEPIDNATFYFEEEAATTDQNNNAVHRLI